MSKVSGKFCRKFLKTTKHYKKFFDKEYDLKDTEFREYYDWDELLDKVEDDRERNQIIDLMKKMLQLDPKKRPSAEDILKHEWLKQEESSSENGVFNF